jgi:hypothetical protein
VIDMNRLSKEMAEDRHEIAVRIRRFTYLTIRKNRVCGHWELQNQPQSLCRIWSRQS